MLCTLLREECQTKNCAWWQEYYSRDEVWKRCAFVQLGSDLRDLQEAISETVYEFGLPVTVTKG